MAVGFGIIGCGLIADFHCRAIQELRGARLVACYNRTPSRAEALAKKYGMRAYRDLKTLLADDAVDVVAVCTASGAHMEPAVQAARAGKHVVVEKPLEITLRRCDRIIEACDKAGVLCSTIFPSRFHESAKRLKEAVDQNRFGRLVLADAYVKWYRTQAYYDSGAWRGTWRWDGGGALMNQAIHSIDLLLWLAGPVADLSARTATLAHERIAVEDAAVASLRFANGALGSIEATTAAYPGFLKRIELYGDAGAAVMEEEDIKVWSFRKATRRDAALRRRLAAKTETGGGASDPAAIGHHGHREQYKDVLRALRTGGRPLIDGPEGRKSVELILAIYQAAERGRTVTLPLRRDPRLAARAGEA